MKDIKEPELLTANEVNKIYNVAMNTYHYYRGGSLSERFVLLRHLALDLASLSCALKTELERLDADLQEQKLVVGINNIMKSHVYERLTPKKLDVTDSKYCIIGKAYPNDLGKFTDYTD